MGIKAFDRMKKLNKENLTTAGAREIVQMYMANTEVTERRNLRIRWMVEYLAETYAKQLDDLEMEIVVEEFHKRYAERGQLEKDLRAKTQDFLFIYSVHRLLEDAADQEWAQQLVASMTKGRETKPAKR
jgi:hypothetical protein